MKLNLNLNLGGQTVVATIPRSPVQRRRATDALGWFTGGEVDALPLLRAAAKSLDLNGVRLRNQSSLVD